MVCECYHDTFWGYEQGVFPGCQTQPTLSHGLIQNLNDPFIEVKGVEKSYQSSIYIYIGNTTENTDCLILQMKIFKNCTHEQYKTVNVFRKGTRVGKENSTCTHTHTI